MNSSAISSNNDSFDFNFHDNHHRNADKYNDNYRNSREQNNNFYNRSSVYDKSASNDMNFRNVRFSRGQS